MRQVYHDLSTYSADLFGINSALYELGGLIVMHDASGCNSTYNTHDEPRWYDMNSMIYVSGLTETDAILGNDQRLIEDMSAAAENEHPRFTAVSVSVLPAYMGTDVTGIARLVERRTGIPSFGFKTNGMDTYIMGASMAFRAIAERFCPADSAQEYAARRSIRRSASSANRDPQSKHDADNNPLRVNLIGVTPLDFSVNGNVEELERTIRDMGYEIQSNWAMGSTLDDLITAPEADVSLVVSSAGLSAARYLQDTFNVPYVTGLPCGPSGVSAVRTLLSEAVRTGRSLSLFSSIQERSAGSDTSRQDPEYSGDTGSLSSAPFSSDAIITIIGEAIHAASIRFWLEQDHGCTNVRVLCPLELDAGALRPGDSRAIGEAEIREFINQGTVVIADPVYSRITDPGLVFIDDPHDAYSGRMYHDRGRIFTGIAPDLLL